MSTQQEPIAAEEFMGADESPAVEEQPEATDAAVEDTPVECDSDEARAWLGAKPTPHWWRPFLRWRPSQAMQVRRRSPLVRVELSDAASLPHVKRQYRIHAGRYRACYEAARRSEPRLEGYWIARITLVPGQVCAVEVIDTRFTDALSTCLRDAVLSVESIDEAGRVELALAFHPEPLR